MTRPTLHPGTHTGSGAEPSSDGAGRSSEALTIGELEARTGVSAATLRAWEQRLGFPQPLRSAGGQRRYRPGDVDMILRVQMERDRGLGLSAAVAAVRHQDTVGAGSLFAQMRAAHPHLDVMEVSGRVMQALTWAIEDECLVHASRPLLLGCFQTEQSFRRAGDRWRELSRTARRAIVLADFPQLEDPAPTTGPERIALSPQSPLLNEWSLICYDAHLSVALIAWERPRVNPQATRRFEGLLTLEPAVVRDAAVRFVGEATANGLEDPVDLTNQLTGGSGGDWRRPMSLLRRFAVYSDADA